MAKNNGKKLLFNTTLQETMEQEGMNRRLKGILVQKKKSTSLYSPILFLCVFPEAGIYDHNDTYEVRKQLDEMLQQSKEDAKKTEKSVPSEQTVASFDDEFNIVEDDDDLKEINYTDTTTSTNKPRKKSPLWKCYLSVDEDENFQTTGKPGSSFKVETKPFQKNASKLQKAKPLNIDSKKFVQATVSYGSKMVAASIKTSDDSTESPNSRSSRRGDLIISPDEIDDGEEFTFKIEPLKGSSRNGNLSSRKGETTMGNKSDTEEDDFIDDPPPRQKENVNRTKTEQSNPSQKLKLATMKTLCKKYSEMLNRIENVPAFPIPEDLDYDSKGPCQLLIENEEKLKVTQSLGYKPIKWRKPIILSANSNRRRRQIFNQPSTSRTTPPIDAQEDSVDAVEIVCDSPPAASMRKLDISPASPVFESNASRKRSGGSNGIIEAEMEVDRKSPIDIKEVLQFHFSFYNSGFNVYPLVIVADRIP